MNKLVKACLKSDVFLEFLKSLNGILGISDREMEVFAELTKLLAARNKDPKAEKNIVDTEARKHIEQNLGVTQDNLCRYLKKFKDKHLLIPALADEEWVVNPILIPELIKNTVQITIILHTYDTVSEEKINKVASIKETGGVADQS